MKERGILYSAPMVRAYRAGLKTQTRRTRGLDKINEAPDEWDYLCTDRTHRFAHNCGHIEVLDIRCPYGIAGDRLYSRETFSFNHPTMSRSELEEMKIPCSPNALITENYWLNRLIYRADGEPDPVNPWRWWPSIHMPRWASRDTAELISVRPERLQSITEEDIQSEGLTEQLVREVICPIVLKANVAPEHWIGGYDEGFSFCRACAEKKITKLKRETPGHEYYLEGGWATEGDSQAFCDNCRRTLDNTFTTYACQSEIDHFREHAWSLSPLDCLSLENIIGSYGWNDHDSCQPENHIAADIHRLGFQALWESINGAGSWAKNPWLWKLSFRRLPA